MTGQPDVSETKELNKEALRQQILTNRREIIQKLEQERGSRVITLIHRKEPWLEEEQSISIEDSEHVLMEIHSTPPKKPIDIIIHTPGGLQLAAEMIGSALKQHPGKVTAIVPFYAMSGGTLIALAADEILMERFSVLGPLDPQINGMASGALVNLIPKKPIEMIADETIILADVAEKALKEVSGYIAWFLGGKKISKGQVKLIVEFLTGGYVAHSRPLSYETLAGLKLPAKQGVPELVWKLFSTCIFGHCERPTLRCTTG
ncbi:ATP-dependent Clp protease proteolytic subunit, partial [Candidatus Acetothermia bacterium]|nr:ATP-dependent Clp protease proteolytic subunit [Candidatus Acetothermia bacterium]